MADLLIKGLEMPKGDLALWIIVHKDGTVEYLDDNKYEGYKTLRNAAVTVPPHGRLIDADALEDDDPDVCNSFMRDGYVESCEWGYSHEQIKNAPTIIPASEVDDGKV